MLTVCPPSCARDCSTVAAQCMGPAKSVRNELANLYNCNQVFVLHGHASTYGLCFLTLGRLGSTAEFSRYQLQEARGASNNFNKA